MDQLVGKKCAVLIPLYPLNEVTTSQMIGTSQIAARTSNTICLTIEPIVFFIIGTPPLYLLRSFLRMI